MLTQERDYLLREAVKREEEIAALRVSISPRLSTLMSAHQGSGRRKRIRRSSCSTAS